MKNNYKILFVILLTIFSFYYTNKTIDIIRNADPIMKNINSKSDKYTLKAVNATITDNTITPGRIGVNVDQKKSYSKMKRYGKYNENLLVFKEEEPSVSLDDIYDKFVISGNEERKEIALIFTIKRDDDIDTLLNIINNADIKVTFFMDGLFIENNMDLVKNLVNDEFEIEVLSYNGRYQSRYFKQVIDILEETTQKEAKYCYSSYTNNKILNMCKNLSLHTIVPNIIVSKRAYSEIKRKITNASIISLNNNDYILEELTTVIAYIKQKGYDIVTVDKLLSER